MTADRSPTRRELALVALAVGFLLAAPLLVPSLRVLVTKPLWLDELHTWLLSRELPGPRLVSALRRGADFNTPLLYGIDAMLLRALPWLPVQVVLRLTSVVSAWVASLLLYRIARQRLDVLPSLAGAMAVLAHATLVIQLFEARFYAPWLALSVAVAWAVGRAWERPESLARHAVLALLCAATATIHYFGVFSLACIGLGVLLAARPVPRAWRVLAAMAVGCLALVLWMPVYLAQREVLSAATWVPATTLGRVLSFLRHHYGWPPYLGVALALVALTAARRLPRKAWRVGPSMAQSAVLGLLALPVVLIVVSYAMQPVLVDRYALPALAGLAMAVALAASLMPATMQRITTLAMVATFGTLVVARALAAEASTLRVGENVASVNGVAGDLRPVVAIDRRAMYPAAFSAANRTARLAYLVLPTEVIRSTFPSSGDVTMTVDFMLVERDAALAHHRVFGAPAVAGLEAVRREPSFFFLHHVLTLDGPIARLFAGYEACRVTGRLLLLTRRVDDLTTIPARGAPPTCRPEQLASGAAAG